MTPEQNMKQVMQQLSDGMLALEKSTCWLERQMDISEQALGRIIYGGNKTGCSLSNAAIVANFLGYKLELTPLSPDSAGVLPRGNDNSQSFK